MAFNCGAPVRYWRIGFKQLGIVTTGHIAIASLLVTDQIRGDVNLITQASEVLLDHVPGVVEVTEPSGPVLDGAVLIDSDSNTKAQADIIDPADPRPWFINIDTGAVIGIVEIELEVFSHHRGKLSDWYAIVQLSFNNVDFQTVDAKSLPDVAVGTPFRLRLLGRGYLDLNNYRPARGFGMIPGITSENSVVKPNSRVFVYERDTMVQVAATLTDVNGNYIVYGLDVNKQYLSMVVDDDGAPKKQPVPWDHVYPSPAQKLSNLEFHHWHNRYEIAKGDICGLYIPGIVPEGSFGVGMADYWLDETHTSPPAYIGGSYRAGYRADSTYTPIRPDVEGILFDMPATANGADLLLMSVVGSNVGNSGITFEGVIGKGAASETWITLTGDFGTNNTSWLTANPNPSGYRGLIRIDWQPRAQETLYLVLTDTQLRVIVKFSNAGVIDQTVTLPATLLDDTLHHLVASVIPGVTFKVFLDGAVVFNLSTVGFGELRHIDLQRTHYAPDDAPAHIANVAFHNAQNNNDLNDFHMAMVAVYSRGLTDIETAGLWSEAQGTYTDAVVVYNESALQAEILADMPSFYMPLQDVSTSNANPAKAYPNPNAFGAATFTTEEVPTGLILAQTIPGSGRVGFKLVDNVEYKRGFIMGIGFMNVLGRSLGGAFHITALPVTGNIYFLRLFHDFEEGDFPVQSRYIHQVFVGSDGKLGVKYAVAAPGNSEATVLFDYVVPVNTHIYFYITIDMAATVVKLYINGVLQETKSVGGFLMFAWAITAAIAQDAGANSTVTVHDIAAYDHVLSEARIAYQYSLT